MDNDAVLAAITLFIVFAFVAGVAIACIVIPLRQAAAERRIRRCVLEGSAEYLLAADQKDMAGLESEMHRIVSILLGEPSEGGLGTELGLACYGWDREEKVMHVVPDAEGVWQPPPDELPVEKRLKSVARRLAASRDVRLIRPLADALRFQPRERCVARFALRALLPFATAEHHPIFDASSLYHLLNIPRQWERGDEELAAAILEAAERTSHIRAIPHVRRLCKDDYTPPEITQTAERCLRSLEAKARQLRLGATLLRPSQEPAEPSQTLLRPAGAPRADPSALLRPADVASQTPISANLESGNTNSD